MKLILSILSGLCACFLVFSFTSEEQTLLPDLSGYHIFRGAMSQLQPSDDFVPYQVSASLFSDYAEKQRLIKLPEGTLLTAINDGLPVFPDGTILVKTFYYPFDKREPAKGRRIIETRVIIKMFEGWTAGTYIWNKEQTEATLLTKGAKLPVEWLDGKGASQKINYEVPTVKQCAGCHKTGNALMPLGPKIRNLNIDVSIDNETINQLKFFETKRLISSINPTSFGSLPSWEDEHNTLEQRARAYLEVNCAHCHQPNGSCASVNFRPAFETSLADSKIKEKGNRIIKLMQRGRMPYLGTTVVHEEGLALVKAYINTLK